MKSRRLQKRMWAAAAFAAAAAIGGAQAAAITLFKQPNFTGDKLTLNQPADNLSGANFQDQASSVVVHSGRWLACTQPDFNGDCMTLRPGRYAQLDARLNHRIESLRAVTQDAYNDRGALGAGDRDHERDRDRHRDRGRFAYSGYAPIEVFTQPDFRGHALPLDGDTPNLLDRDQDEGPSSLVIHEGMWQLCSEPGFAGDCEVYKPGRYADLGDLTHRLGSLRRIG